MIKITVLYENGSEGATESVYFSSDTFMENQSGIAVLRVAQYLMHDITWYNSKQNEILAIGAESVDPSTVDLASLTEVNNALYLAS